VTATQSDVHNRATHDCRHVFVHAPYVCLRGGGEGTADRVQAG